MKKIISSIVLTLISATTFSQKIVSDNITVSGQHTYTIEPAYSAKMIVSLNNVYYDAQGMTLSEIKSGYIDKLVKAGISKDKLKEDDLAYALMSYEKAGTIVEFRTESLDEMKRFLQVKSIGVSQSETRLNVRLTEEEMANYAKAAYDDAKSKALAIAKKIGRELGKALYITDSNTKETNEALYYASPLKQREYFISVSFELL